jgi:hypothetical protein
MRLLEVCIDTDKHIPEARCPYTLEFASTPAAIIGRLVCYKWSLALLQSAARAATIGRWRCYKWPPCYKWLSVLLQLAGSAATNGRRRYYKCPSVLLQFFCCRCCKPFTVIAH